MFKALIGLTAMTASLIAFDATIPVVDMRDYYSEDRREIFIEKVGQALREVGFFAVCHSGIDQDLLDLAYSATTEFYHLPLEEKMLAHDAQNNGQRGFVPGESAKGQAVMDFKEYFHMGRQWPEDALKAQGYPENIWPESPSYRESMIKLYHALERLMVPLQETLAVAIGQPKDAFYDMTQRGNCVLRSIYYPPNPPKNTIWAAEHTDVNLFTILPRATARGLQVKTPAGQWVEVLTPKDAVIINAGDMLAHLSNGEVRAGPHRVVALGEDYERVSMVFFVHPTNETDLTPNHIALNRTGGTFKKASGRAWEVFAERIVENGLASEQMKRDLGKSGYLEKQLRIGNASFEAMQVIADSGNASPEVLAALESRR